MLNIRNKEFTRLHEYLCMYNKVVYVYEELTSNVGFLPHEAKIHTEKHVVHCTLLE